MKDFLQLFRYIKPYKVNAVSNICFNFLGAFFALFSFSLAIPFLGILFDTQNLVLEKPVVDFSAKSLTQYFQYYISQIIVNQGKSTALLMISTLIIITSFLKNGFLYLAGYNMAPIMNGVVKDMQNKIYHKITSLPLAYFSIERKGNIMARLTNDVLEIKVSIMSSLEILFRDPLIIIMYFAALIYMSPTLTIIVTGMLPISGILIGVIGKKLRNKAKISREKYGELISIVEETLSGLRIIKAFNAEKNINNKFIKENNYFTRIINKVTRISALASPLSEFLGTIIVILILYIGSNMVLGEKTSLTPQDFIGYLIIFSQLINPIKSLSNSYYNIQKGLASYDRVKVIIDAEDKIIEKTDAKEIKQFNSCIEFKNVTFKYDEKGNVLKNINFKIEKGKTIALVGQSGSGKSTLVDLIPRFYDLDEGEILIDGVNIKDYKINDLRQLMGNVNQESILFNDTVFNNIAFGAENAKENDVIDAAKVSNAHGFIMELPQEYQTTIGDRGGKLSGGQRQRLSIARAVFKNPPIMILDEATSALDTESERLVQEALIQLMKNRTSIVIAHRLSTIKHADEIYVLQNGEIVERGNHDELIERKGIYKKLHDLQMF